MSNTHYIPGGELSLLPASPMKNGQGTWPPSLLIATRRGKIIISAETAAGLLQKMVSDPRIQDFLKTGIKN